MPTMLLPEWHVLANDPYVPPPSPSPLPQPKQQDKLARQSKYIAGLLETAQHRKREQDVLYERRMVKERKVRHTCRTRAMLVPTSFVLCFCHLRNCSCARVCTGVRSTPVRQYGIAGAGSWGLRRHAFRARLPRPHEPFAAVRHPVRALLARPYPRHTLHMSFGFLCTCLAQQSTGGMPTNRLQPHRHRASGTFLCNCPSGILTCATLPTPSLHAQAEDHLFEDKEVFVTSAYRKKLEEDKKWQEAERQKWVTGREFQGSKGATYTSNGVFTTAGGGGQTAGREQRVGQVEYLFHSVCYCGRAMSRRLAAMARMHCLIGGGAPKKDGCQ